MPLPEIGLSVPEICSGTQTRCRRFHGSRVPASWLRSGFLGQKALKKSQTQEIKTQKSLLLGMKRLKSKPQSTQNE
jgi:hypothetical protein